MIYSNLFHVKSSTYFFTTTLEMLDGIVSLLTENLFLVAIVVVALGVGWWWFMSPKKTAPPSSIQGSADMEADNGYMPDPENDPGADTMMDTDVNHRE